MNFKIHNDYQLEMGMSKKANHTGKTIHRLRRTLMWYISRYNGHGYKTCPSNSLIESDICDIIKKINDTTLTSSFAECKSKMDRMQFFYNYIKATVREVPRDDIKRSTLEKLQKTKLRKISQSWVNSKISKLHGDDKWKAVRYQALKAGGGKCCLCGRNAHDGIKLHVDHIKPKSIYPELMYDLDNLQVLCEDCNMGKCNYDNTDWRN